MVQSYYEIILKYDKAFEDREEHIEEPMIEEIKIQAIEEEKNAAEKEYIHEAAEEEKKVELSA